MNIFYLDHDQRRCAEMHNDKHCVKMIVEYAQLLSTAHRVLDGQQMLTTTKNGRKIKRWMLGDWRDDVFYQSTHINHKSAVWTRETHNNYKWLYYLFLRLMDEYTYRYEKTHATSSIAYILATVPKNIPEGPFTPPPPAMPDECKVLGSSLESYHNYYRMNKEHIAKWSKRSIPWFYAK